jgi:hypothetical protein
VEATSSYPPASDICTAPHTVLLSGFNLPHNKPASIHLGMC